MENLGGGLVDGAKHIAAVLVGEVLQPKAQLQPKNKQPRHVEGTCWLSAD